VLNGEATNTNFIVFGLTRSGLETTIYRTRGDHAIKPLHHQCGYHPIPIVPKLDESAGSTDGNVAFWVFYCV